MNKNIYRKIVLSKSFLFGLNNRTTCIMDVNRNIQQITKNIVIFKQIKINLN